MDCKWSPFKPVTGCSKTCGGGIQHFERFKINEAENGGACCMGNGTKIQACHEERCPDGKYFFNILHPASEGVMSEICTYLWKDYLYIKIVGFLKPFYFTYRTMIYT